MLQNYIHSFVPKHFMLFTKKPSYECFHFNICSNCSVSELHFFKSLLKSMRWIFIIQETQIFYFFRWYYLDEYTPCQPTCGNSSQQRLVECVEENTQQPDQHIFYAVPGKFCMGPMPQMLKSCTSADTCQASWGLSLWEKVNQ